MDAEIAWTRVRNLAADATGSIHDDAEARRRGLPGGLVPGNVQLVLATRGVVDALGAGWLAAGTLRFVWRRPLYEGDRVRLRIEDAPCGQGEARALAFVLEQPDGTPAATGRAALAEAPERARAPWSDDPAPTPVDPARDPLPEEPLGFEHRPKSIRLGAREVEGALADLDPSPWYRERSPWGPPILPVVAFLPFTGQGRRREPRAPAESVGGPSRIRAGMNGALDLVLRGPLFRDEPYERRMVTVDKGFARRSAFRTLEISLADAQDRRLWHARWRANWFPSPEDGARA